MIISIDRLHVLVTEHDGAEHDLFAQFLRFGFHHQNRVHRAGDDEVELGVRHLVDRRIQAILTVDVTDARGADRAHERHAGDRQRRGRRDQADDIGIVFHVVRKHLHHDLRLVAIAFGEQRTDRAVDQARRSASRAPSAHARA